MKLSLPILYRRLLIFSLIWITIEGVFRKWLLPNLSSQLFGLKYFFFTFVYLLYLLQNYQIKAVKSSYQFLIIVLTFWCVFQFLNNPYHAPLIVLTFGLVIYLFFIPLTIIIPTYFTKISSLETFIKYLAYLSIPIFIIGIMQYYLPVDHPLNYLVNADQLENRVGGFTRALSIFTFVKIYDIYLIFTLTLFVSYILYLSYIGKSTYFYSVLLVFGIINLFMTGSRLQVFQLGFNTIIIFVFSFFQIKQLRKHIVFFLIISIFLSIVLYSTSQTVQESIDAFTNRVEHTESIAQAGKEGYSTKDRVFDRINIFVFSEHSGWIGLGLGTTYQGTGSFLSTKRTDFYYEEEGERIVLELGIIGGIIVALLRLSILFYSINVLLKIKNTKYLLLTIPFVLYIFPPTLFLTNLTFNYYDGFAYWFSFSLILSLEKSYINLKSLQST